MEKSKFNFYLNLPPTFIFPDTTKVLFKKSIWHFKVSLIKTSLILGIIKVDLSLKTQTVLQKILRKKERKKIIDQ